MRDGLMLARHVSNAEFKQRKALSGSVDNLIFSHNPKHGTIESIHVMIYIYFRDALLIFESFNFIRL